MEDEKTLGSAGESQETPNAQGAENAQGNGEGQAPRQPRPRVQRPRITHSHDTNQEGFMPEGFGSELQGQQRQQYRPKYGSNGGYQPRQQGGYQQRGGYQPVSKVAISSAATMVSKEATNSRTSLIKTI